MLWHRVTHTHKHTQIIITTFVLKKKKRHKQSDLMVWPYNPTIQDYKFSWTPSLHTPPPTKCYREWGGLLHPYGPCTVRKIRSSRSFSNALCLHYQTRGETHTSTQTVREGSHHCAFTALLCTNKGTACRVRRAPRQLIEPHSTALRILSNGTSISNYCSIPFCGGKDKDNN